MNGSMQIPTLLLQVTQVAGAAPTHPLQASFDPQGGSIGRREDNDWVLPDPQRIISGRHAMISFTDGRYLVTDVSSNGIYLNHAETPLGTEGQASLQEGDTLTIGEYEIRVTLQQPVTQVKEASSFDALEDPYARLLDEHAGIHLAQDLPPMESSPTPTTEANYSLEESVATDFEEDTPAIPATEPNSSESNHISDLNSYFSGPAMIPEDWQSEQETTASSTAAVAPHDDTGRLTEQPHHQTTASSIGTTQSVVDDIKSATKRDSQRVPIAQGESELRETLARGMGLSHTLPDDIPFPEILENLGKVLRSNIEGSMSILRARTQMKSEFRMSQTMIRPVENNPLKFSINTEEALRHIIDPRPKSGYLSPLAAFQEAHEDTEAHMLAVMVGMQSALKAVLLRFKPENLEQRLQQSALLDKVPLYRRAKSWELYNNLYSEIANEVEDDFQQVFGRAFSQAYESQIKRLDDLKNSHNETGRLHRN
jgi:type VI secretion system protein